MPDPAIQMTLTVEAPADVGSAPVLGGGVRVVGADMSLVVSLALFDADGNLLSRITQAERVCLPATGSVTWSRLCGGLSPLTPGTYQFVGLAFQTDTPTPVASQRKVVELTIPTP